MLTPQTLKNIHFTNHYSNILIIFNLFFHFNYYNIIIMVLSVCINQLKASDLSLIE